MSDYDEYDELEEEEYYDEEQGEDGSYIPSYEDVLAAQRITMQDVLDHITGPVISIILHVVLLSVLGTMVIFHAPEERKDIEVKVEEIDIKEPEEIPDPPEPPEEEVTETVEVEIERPEIASDPVSEVTVDEVAVEDVQVEIEMPTLLAIKPNNSALVLPGVFAARSGKGRKGALKRYGGTGRGQAALEKGLRWLAENQKADGSWADTKGNKPALTGLALLAFLAHGDTPASPKYGTTVLKAIKKLIEYSNNTKPNGTVVCDGHQYGNAIVTYALSEAAALTNIPAVEETMNKLIAPIIKGQHPTGSFDYNYKTGTRIDLSYAGWNFQALKAAFAAGSTAEGLENAIEKAIKGISAHRSSQSGGFNYGAGGNKGGGSQTMTSVGTLCLQLFGAGKSVAAKGGVKYIETAKNGEWLDASWKKKESDKWALYAWYYQTQALFQGYSGKGGSWKTWNAVFQKNLISEQEKDGHWDTPAHKYGKANAGHGESGMGGDMDRWVYGTSLCCLMLEVYYRYLPTFKVVKHSKGEAGAGDDEDDLIKID